MPSKKSANFKVPSKASDNLMLYWFVARRVTKLAYGKPLLVIGIILLASTISKAQVSAPKYSNEFLSIGVGARAIGMGNAQVAVVNDVTSGYWNPAGLTQNGSGSAPNKYQGALMHAEYFAGIASYDYGAFSTMIDNNSYLGVSLIRFAVDNIADTRYLIQADNIDYSRIRRFSSADNAAIISYGRKNIGGIKGLSAGANFKIIYRNAGNFGTAWGFGLDAGLQYKTGQWQLGVMARDVTSTFNAWAFNTAELATAYGQTGNTIPENSIEITLPKWILGLGRNINITKHINVLLCADADFTFDGKRNVPISTSVVSIDPKAGIELGYKKIVYLRGGVNNIQKIRDFDGSTHLSYQPSFGVGLRIKQFSIDYALTDLGSQSEALYSNIFSLKVAIQ